MKPLVHDINFYVSPLTHFVLYAKTKKQKMKENIKYTLLAILFMSVFSFSVHAQKEANYDEAKVGKYTLPSVLTLANGKKVCNKKDWPVRRKEILNLFRENVYGEFPGRPKDMHFSVLKEDNAALSGKATAKQVRIYFTKETAAPFMDVILYLPAQAKNPVPVFAGLNFKGNQCINADSNIILSEKYAELLKQTGSLLRGFRTGLSKRLDKRHKVNATNRIGH